MATIPNGKGTVCLATFDNQCQFVKHEFGRPPVGPRDVCLDIKYCGMCHSDVHACNGDWNLNAYPLTPGHEVAGIVTSVGDEVQDIAVGDRVGVGCYIECCLTCELCKAGLHSYCRSKINTYGKPYPKDKGHDECAGHYTNGGYSSQMTVKRDFVYKVPDNVALEYVGPLLCAGITMWSPLNKHVIHGMKAKSVAIVGFGGLGQMGIKLAKALGCDVTVLSRSTSKEAEAAKLGAKLIAHSDKDAMAAAAFTFDLVLDTVSSHHDVAAIMSTLKVGGAYVCIGVIPQAIPVTATSLIMNRYSLEGSLVGGIPETQEMLDFCSKHNVMPEIKIIHAKDTTAQFKAMEDGSAGAVRAVIDMTTLKELN